MRKATVAGMFYSQNPEELGSQIDRFIGLDNQGVADKVDREHIVGIAVPHAGYVFSGLTAGRAYAWLAPAMARKVVILGVSHRVPFHGFSVFNGEAYETPLGLARTDREIAEILADSLGRTAGTPDNHNISEHSIEVQVPFVQRLFPEAAIIPVMAGMVGGAEVAEAGKALAELCASYRDLVIVASTDMSHFHDLPSAENMDEKTLSLMDRMDMDGLAHSLDEGTSELCGAAPVLALMGATVILKGKSRVIDYTTSAEASGDSERVVGYGAVGFYVPHQGETQS